MGVETVTVPAWKLRRAAEVLDRDGDEHGVAADLWSMLADAKPVHEAGHEEGEAHTCVVAKGQAHDKRRGGQVPASMEAARSGDRPVVDC